MDFLKALFGDGESLTFEQFADKAKAAGLKIANIADGTYVSREKYDGKVGTLTGTVNDLKQQIEKRDTDLADLNTKLTAATADAAGLVEARNAISTLQSQYNSEKENWEAKFAQQAYEYAIREKAGELHFSSGSAKKAFIADAIAKSFKMDGETMMGYEQFVADYKAADPSAFAVEKPAETTPAPIIVLPSGGAAPVANKVSLADMMRAKNANPGMEVNFQ